MCHDRWRHAHPGPVSTFLPLALPAHSVGRHLCFTLSWNEFIYALVFLSSTDIKTIPVGVVSELIRGDVFFWGLLMAGALLGSIPVAIIYSFFCRILCRWPDRRAVRRLVEG